MTGVAGARLLNTQVCYGQGAQYISGELTVRISAACRRLLRQSYERHDSALSIL